jgi:serine protease Do
MTRRLLATVALLAALAAPAVAADAKGDDKGKKLLPRLFESAAAAAAESTARIQVNKKDVILGTVVSKDGFILTKGSELIDAKENRPKATITCLLRDGSVFDAEVKGYDPQSDLMLLKVDAEVLTPVAFADPAKAEPGNWVTAPAWRNGSKTGQPDDIAAVTVGVVSSASRKLYLPESRIENGNRGYLGITFARIDKDTDTTIGEVSNESARKAGIKPGDAIVALNDKAVANKEDIFDVMNTTRPGETLTVKVKRKAKDKDKEDEELTFKVKTIHLAGMDRGALQNVMGGNLSDRRGGFGKVIQHDTVLLPEQCGGPLVDLEGNVLGLNIARAGRVETWALPGDLIATVFKELKDGKHPFPKKEAVSKETKKEARDDEK